MGREEDGQWVGEEDGQWVGEEDGQWVGEEDGQWVGEEDGQWIGEEEVLLVRSLRGDICEQHSYWHSEGLLCSKHTYNWPHLPTVSSDRSFYN